MRTDDPCRGHAPILAALEEYTEAGLDPLAVAAARAHLATCPRCQARRRAWAAMDGALRATLRADGASMAATTADLLAAIGADHEPRERRTPMLSVVTLKDVDEMDGENQPEPAEHDAPNTTATTGPTFAALPSLKPGPRQPRWRRSLTGLVAVAAVVALVAGVFGALNLSGRLRGATGAHSAKTAATATAKASQANQNAGPPPAIYGLNFTSPTDGWLVVSSSNGAGSGDLYHDTSGHLAKVSSIPNAEGQSVRLRVFSPSDMWAIAVPGVGASHFDGHTWTLVNLPTPPGVTGIEGSPTIGAMDIVSPTEGWAVGSAFVYFSPTGAQVLTNFFYHYDGSSWTLDPADSQAMVAQLGGADATPTPDTGQGGPSNQPQLTGVSATPGGDVWATGYIQLQAGSPNSGYSGYDATSFLYHRVNGVWHVAQVAPHTEYDNILMTGPHSGWIIGQTVQVVKGGGSIPYTSVSYSPAVWSWDGARWSQAAIPAPTAFQDGLTLRQIAATSPSNVWILGATDGSSMSSGAYASDTDYLIHYDGASWSTVALPQIGRFNPNNVTALTQVSFDQLAVTDSGGVWIAGNLITGVEGSGKPFQFVPLLYSYANGQWTSNPLPRFT